MVVLTGPGEAGCFRQVAALYSDHYRQAPPWIMYHLDITTLKYAFRIDIPCSGAHLCVCVCVDDHQTSNEHTHDTSTELARAALLVDTLG